MSCHIDLRIQARSDSRKSSPEITRKRCRENAFSNSLHIDHPREPTFERMNSFLRLWPQIEPLPAPRTGGGRKNAKTKENIYPGRPTTKEKEGSRKRKDGEKKVGAAPPRYTCKESCDTHSSASALGMFLFSRLSFLPFLRGKNVFTQRGKGVSGQSDGEEHMMSQSKKADRGSCFLFFEGTNGGGNREICVSISSPLLFRPTLHFSSRAIPENLIPKLPLPSPPIIQGHKSATDIWKLPRKRRSQKVAK